MSNLEFGEKVDRHCPGCETTLRNHLGEVGGNICPVCWKVYDIPSEPSLTTQPKVIDVIEKLKARYGSAVKAGTSPLKFPTKEFQEFACVAYDNMPEIIQRLEQTEVLREALRYYAKEHKNPSDGPWGRYSDDHGDVARNAINQTKLT